MQIQTRVVYSVGNVDFDSEKKAREWIYDQIGNLMSKALSDHGAGVIGPRGRIAIVDCLTENAAQFAILLRAYSSPVSDE